MIFYSETARPARNGTVEWDKCWKTMDMLAFQLPSRESRWGNDSIGKICIKPEVIF